MGTVLARPKLVFTIPGRPVPLERARVESTTLPNGKRFTHSRTPDKSLAYRQDVQLRMNIAVVATRRAPAPWPSRTKEAISLSLWIYWEDGNHGDGSNLLKAIEDAGNGLLWHDDKQIAEAHFYSTIDRSHPRVELIVQVLGGECAQCSIWKNLGKACPAHDDGRGLEVVE